MIKKIAAVAFVASVSCATAALADDIPATPMNHGPMVVRGMGPAGDLMNVGLTPLNVLTPPTLAVTGAVAGAAPMAAAEPMAAEPGMMKRRHHHGKHAMMKRKMMKKKM